MTEMSQHTTLFAALAAAQKGFTVIVKNRVNPAFHSRYADIEAILQSVRPALNANGLFLSQSVTTDGGMVSVETIVTHQSGETLRSGVTQIPVGVSKNQAQAVGSAITYARRYSLAAFLGVSADDDDDGNGAGEAQSSPRPAPAPARPAFALTQDMVNEATVYAQKGSAAYKAYYDVQTNEWKKAMFQSGTHQRLKDIAAKHDMEVNHE